MKYTCFTRYGSDAGKLAENGLYAIGNTAMTAYNADNLGVKAIAKRAAKDTGKALLLDSRETRTVTYKSGGGATVTESKQIVKTQGKLS